MTSQGRIETFDLVKFVAIFAVLWGHVVQYVVPGLCYENRVYQIIYSFHMPLFMIVVGYFSVRSIGYPFKDVLVKKFWQLIVPGVVYALSICILM